MKSQLARGKYTIYSENNIRQSLYRPFTNRYLYFDSLLNDRRLLQHFYFPNNQSELENIVVVVSDVAYRASFSVLATNMIPELHLCASTDAFQCFPFYTYTEDGSNRCENITDWALTQFREQYGEHVTKWDIFHYIYAMLHHPAYRKRYVENLKRDLPRIPLLSQREAFTVCVRIGKALIELHLHYETVKEYNLKWIENKDESINWRVEKMKLSSGKDTLKVNEWLTLTDIPQELSIQTRQSLSS